MKNSERARLISIVTPALLLGSLAGCGASKDTSAGGGGAATTTGGGSSSKGSTGGDASSQGGAGGGSGGSNNGGSGGGGASACGTIGYVAAPCHGMAIGANDDLPGAVDAQPAGTTFCIKAGVHRLTHWVQPKENDVFIGENGAILSGAQVLDTAAFKQQGSGWVITGQTQHNFVFGSCDATLDPQNLCQLPDDVFLDDTRLTRVGSAAEVGPGKFFFDYPNTRIFIGDAPQGHKVEASITEDAFRGAPWTNQGAKDGVTIRGLVMEKFASPAQRGVVFPLDGKKWTIEGNEIRLSHGAGLCGSTDGIVRNNHVHDMGEIGMCGSSISGTGFLVESNEIDHNHELPYDCGWECGGGKWAETDGLVLKDNCSHDNYGPGLWMDIDNKNFTIEGNIVENNDGPGIFDEISFTGKIVKNHVTGNGKVGGVWGWSAGILLSSSGDAEVAENYLDDNFNGISIIQQHRDGDGVYPTTHIAKNDWVHDNVIKMNSGRSGMWQDVDHETNWFTGNSNRFENNTYYLGAAATPFEWMNEDETKTQWVGNGEDAAGAFHTY